MRMSGDRGSKQVRGKALREVKPPRRTRKKAASAPEELGPEGRVELAQQIEAKRFRGKPPSI
jgi:hypothetical protein